MYSPFTKITYLLAFPPTASERIFSAVWIAFFRAIVLILRQIKFNSHAVLFFFFSINSFLQFLHRILTSDQIRLNTNTLFP